MPRNLIFTVILHLVVLSGTLRPSPLHADEEPSPGRPEKASLLNPAILTIRTWQLFSMHSPVHIVNCQFRPSCSEYGIAAIQETGTLRGVLYATDRVIRCNPGARRYYDHDGDGRLLDGFTPGPQFESRTAPQVFIPLSLALPGLNKMVNGRFADGLTTLLVTDLTGYAMYASLRNESWLAIPCALMFSAFYGSDIYFNCLSIGER